MALIPQTFPAPTEAAIASFSFTDIADGSGNVIFLGLAAETSGGVTYHLVQTAIFSQPPATGRSSQGTTTIDFNSSTFNLPRIAKGTATFSAAMGVTGGESVKLLVTVIHFDGSTETVIGAEQTSQTFTGGESEMVSFRFTLTETLFKKGDLIRLRVKLNQVNAAGSSEVGHDPNNEDATFIKPGTKHTTVMQLHMPFKIDV